MNILRLTIICLFIIGCSTAKPRSNNNSIWSNNNGIIHLDDYYRSGIIYKEFKIVIEIDSILKNTTYYNDLAKFITNSGFTIEEFEENLLPVLYEDNIDSNEFIMIIYNPNYSINELNFDKYWNIELFINEKKVSLLEINELESDSIDYKFLINNTGLIDRWTDVFIFKFEQSPENFDYPKKLMIKGISGETWMEWKLKN